jgi:F0F1-type ATP synthase membrane subunit b/b'
MDINVTILFQLGLFLFVLVSLTGILIRPFLRIVEERHQKIHGTKSEVDRLERLATENQTAYVARVREARLAAKQEVDALRSAGNEEKRKLLAQVRAEIAAALNKTRDEIRTSEDKARDALQKESDALARQLVSKLAGREVSP